MKFKKSKCPSLQKCSTYTCKVNNNGVCSLKGNINQILSEEKDNEE